MPHLPVDGCGVMACCVWQLQWGIESVPVVNLKADPAEVVMRQTFRLEVGPRLDPALLIDPLRVRDVVDGAKYRARLSPRSASVMRW